MSADQPLPHAVRAEVQNVVWAEFYYRDDFKSLMLGAGVPAAIYNRYDDPDIANVKIARAVLDELQQLGCATQDNILSGIGGRQPQRIQGGRHRQALRRPYGIG